MRIEESSCIIRPVGETQAERELILEVYRQCEDFLALGPVSTATMEMVLADLEHSRQDGGTFCGIWDHPLGELLGIVDVVTSGFEGVAEDAFLSLLMIAAPNRRKGLGARVVKLVEAYVQDHGPVRVMWAGVQVNNPNAICFWQRMGYAIVSGPIDFPDGTTAFQLKKDLSTVV